MDLARLSHVTADRNLAEATWEQNGFCWPVVLGTAHDSLETGQLSLGTAAAPSVNWDNSSHLIESGSKELEAEPEVDLSDPLSWNLLLPESWKFWNLSKQHHLLRPNIETRDPIRDISDSSYNILSPSRQARYTQADRNFASTMDKCKGLFALSQAKLKPYKKRRPDSEQFISHQFAVAGKGTLGHCWWAYFSTGVKLQCYCSVWHHHENAWWSFAWTLYVPGSYRLHGDAVLKLCLALFCLSQ